VRVGKLEGVSVKRNWSSLGCAAFLVGVATAAQASDWVVSDTKPGEHRLLDRASIQQSGSTIRIWVKTVWDKPHATSSEIGPIDEWLGRYAINCETRQTSTIVSELKYHGNTVYYVGTQTAFSDIVPDSPMEQLSAKLCSK
jgi:hypothetical protein